MPSLASSSRDFAVHALARLRAGAAGVTKGLNEAGPEIPAPEPFGPGSATTAAGLMNVGVAAARALRERANYRLRAKAAELEQEKTRAEIAKLRAEVTGRYDLQVPGGQKVGGLTGPEYIAGYDRLHPGSSPGTSVKLTRDIGPYKAGTEVPTAELSVYMQGERQKEIDRRATTRAGSVKRYSAAKAAIGDIDARTEALAKRNAQRAVDQTARAYDPLLGLGANESQGLAGLFGPSGPTNEKLVGKALKRYGIAVSPQDWIGSLSVADKRSAIVEAKKQLYASTLERSRAGVSAVLAPQRRLHEDVITRESLNLQPSAQPTPEEAASA